MNYFLRGSIVSWSGVPRALAVCRPIAAAAAGFFLCGCPKEAGSKAASGAPPVPVETAVAAVRTIPLEEAAIGTVEPLSSVRIKPKVGGEIIGVDFEDGAFVKTGEVLFRIDPSSYDVVLKRAEANLAMAQSSASNALDQAKRYTTLIDKGAASKEQFSQFLSTATAQKAQLDARQADVEEARLATEWATVHSPIDGRAGAALVKRGNIVQANSEVLAVVNQMKPIYVSFSVPENDLADVRSRMEGGSLAVEAIDAETGKPLGTGVLSFIDNTVDRTSAMVNMKAQFPNEDESLWPGRFVDVKLTLGEEKDALVVPSAAVIEGQNGAQVFVVAGGVANLRPVEVGRTYGPLSVIRSGLEAGETVVVSGQLRIAPGGKVEDKPPRTGPSPQQGDRRQ
ncbi:MAG: efflux RND transporter periplasmic adaptor subunit [Verrucomicrobiota bacterium]